MSLVAIPAKPVARKIQWKLRQPTQVNRSEFTSRRKVTRLSMAPRWMATVEYPPIKGEPAAYAWRAFAIDCDGQANSFRLIACERDQITGVNVQANGSGQAGFAINTDGWGAAGTKLLRGQFVTIADQLLMLTADVVADASGNARIQFKPYLRLGTIDNAPIEVRRPYALMSMADDEAGWAVAIAQEYSITFDCEESY